MPCSIIVFHKIIYSNATLFDDPVSVCKLSSPELGYCVQSPALVRSESGLGVILEDGRAAAASDGGEHIVLFLFCLPFAFRSFVMLIPF